MWSSHLKAFLILVWFWGEKRIGDSPPVRQFALIPEGAVQHESNFQQSATRKAEVMCRARRVKNKGDLFWFWE